MLQKLSMVQKCRRGILSSLLGLGEILILCTLTTGSLSYAFTSAFVGIHSSHIEAIRFGDHATGPTIMTNPCALLNNRKCHGKQWRQQRQTRRSATRKRTVARFASVDDSLQELHGSRQDPELDLVYQNDGSAFNKENKKNIELWLDLRDTDINPVFAVSYLTENLNSNDDTDDDEDDDEDDNNFTFEIDKVLMTTKDNDVIVRQVINKNNNDEKSFEILDPKNLIVEDGAGNKNCNDDKDSLILSSSPKSKQQHKNCCGKLVRSEPGSSFLVDPLFALDTISSSAEEEGGWLVLEKNDEDQSNNKSDRDWLEEVDGLISFLSPSVITGADGGIAICCPNQSFLVELIKILPGGPGKLVFTTTSDGILLPTSRAQSTGDNDENLSSGSGADYNNNNDISLRIAIILTLDIALWNVACNMISPLK